MEIIGKQKAKTVGMVCPDCKTEFVFSEDEVEIRYHPRSIELMVPNLMYGNFYHLNCPKCHRKIVSPKFS